MRWKRSKLNCGLDVGGKDSSKVKFEYDLYGLIGDKKQD